MSKSVYEHFSFSSAKSIPLRCFKDRISEFVGSDEPLMITDGSRHKLVAILMSPKVFTSYRETEYLLSTPENSRRLMQAVQEVENGNVVVHDIVEE